MLKIYSILLYSVLLISTSYAQIKISGQIKNAPDSTEIMIYYYNNSFQVDAIVVGNTVLDGSGYFSYTHDLKSKKYANLKIGEFYADLYLCPGDEIIINVEYNNFRSSFNVECKYKQENMYLHTLEDKSYPDKIIALFEIKNPDYFVERLTEIEKEHKSFFNQNLKYFKDLDFIDYNKTNIKYKFLYYRTLYINNPKYQVQPTENYFHYLDSIDLNLPKMLNSQYYNSCLEQYLYFKFDKLIPKAKPFDELSIKEKEEILSQSYENIKRTLKGEVLNYVLSTFMKYELIEVKTDTPFIKQMLNNYYTICTNDAYKITVKDYYFKRSAQNQKIIPNFELEDIYGEKFNIHSLKGKYIYIDFWASWCYPCKVYLKDYPILLEKNKNRKDIVYLFINVMDERSYWSEYVVNNPQYGINWFADKVNTKKIRDYFELDAIPRYVIVDKNLKIIDVDAEIPKKVIIPTK